MSTLDEATKDAQKGSGLVMLPNVHKWVGVITRSDGGVLYFKRSDDGGYTEVSQDDLDQTATDWQVIV